MSNDGIGLESRRERTVRRIAWAVTALGVVIAVIGAAQPVSFGWFGWAPAEQEIIVTPTVVLLHPLAAAGLVIAIAAGLASAYLQGRLRGRRQSTPPEEV